MKAYSVFFSEQGKGWERAEVPAYLADCGYESLVNWAAWQTRQLGLKGFLVSENPNPFPLLRRRARQMERMAREHAELGMVEEEMERMAV